MKFSCEECVCTNIAGVCIEVYLYDHGIPVAEQPLYFVTFLIPTAEWST